MMIMDRASETVSKPPQLNVFFIGVAVVMVSLHNNRKPKTPAHVHLTYTQIHSHIHNMHIDMQTYTRMHKHIYTQSLHTHIHPCTHVYSMWLHRHAYTAHSHPHNV